MERKITEVLNEIKNLATINTDVALSCFYVLFNDKDKPFVGISVRFAEIIASCWTNIEVGTKIIHRNEDQITIQGYANDVQKNSKFTVDSQLKITDKSSEEIVKMTNASSSIAFRNVIFKAIPGALFTGVIKEIKKYIILNLGKEDNLEILEWFQENKVSNEALEKKLKVNDINSLSSEKTFLLIGIKNAIQDGDATIPELFKTIKTKSKYSYLGSENNSPTNAKEDLKIFNSLKKQVKKRGRPKKIKL